MKKLMILGVAMFLFSYSSYALGALYSISHPKFSSYVDPKDDYRVIQPAQDGKIVRNSLTKGVLYFSVTIIGGEAALKHLEDNQHLDLTVSIWGDNRRKDSVEIGIRPREWLDNAEILREEYRRMGFFTWRTFMTTKKIWHSKIDLVLVDDNDHTVGPPGYSQSYRATIRIVD